MDYVEAFENLKPNEKYGRKTPHKAVLLLTIIVFIKYGKEPCLMTILYLGMRISHFGLCKMKIFGILFPIVAKKRT